MRMAYNGGTMSYDTPFVCNIPANQEPQDPYHLLFDANDGIIVIDQGDNRVKVQAACDGASDAVNFDNNGGIWDRPWGVAVNPAGGYLVSDEQADALFAVDAAGDVTLYDTARLDRPRGIQWVGRCKHLRRLASGGQHRRPLGGLLTRLQHRSPHRVPAQRPGRYRPGRRHAVHPHQAIGG